MHFHIIKLIFFIFPIKSIFSDDRTVLNEVDRGLCSELSTTPRTPTRKRPRVTGATSLAVSEFSTPPQTVSRDLLDLFEASEEESSMNRIVQAVTDLENSARSSENMDTPVPSRLDAIEQALKSQNEVFQGYERRLNECENRISHLERELRLRDEQLQSRQQELQTCKQRLSRVEKQLAAQSDVQHVNVRLDARHDRPQANRRLNARDDINTANETIDERQNRQNVNAPFNEADDVENTNETIDVRHDRQYVNAPFNEPDDVERADEATAVRHERNNDEAVFAERDDVEHVNAPVDAQQDPQPEYEELDEVHELDARPELERIELPRPHPRAEIELSDDDIVSIHPYDSETGMQTLSQDEIVKIRNFSRTQRIFEANLTRRMFSMHERAKDCNVSGVRGKVPLSPTFRRYEMICFYTAQQYSCTMDNNLQAAVRRTIDCTNRRYHDKLINRKQNQPVEFAARGADQ